jgi:hypothetical protein
VSGTVIVRHHQKLANVDVSLMKGHDMTDKILSQMGHHDGL